LALALVPSTVVLRTTLVGEEILVAVVGVQTCTVGLVQGCSLLGEVLSHTFAGIAVVGISRRAEEAGVSTTAVILASTGLAIDVGTVSLALAGAIAEKIGLAMTEREGSQTNGNGKSTRITSRTREQLEALATSAQGIRTANLAKRAVSIEVNASSTSAGGAVQSSVTFTAQGAILTSSNTLAGTSSAITAKADNGTSVPGIVSFASLSGAIYGNIVHCASSSVNTSRTGNGEASKIFEARPIWNTSIVGRASSTNRSYRFAGISLTC